MYKQSELTGLIYDNNNIVIPNDDNFQSRKALELWLSHGNNLQLVPFIGNEENEQKTKLYNEKLKFVVSDLRIRAKGLAIGKFGTPEYIFSQVDFYKRKHENAVDPNPISEIDADLEAEGMRDFGITLPLFKQLIDYMYSQGEMKERLLNSFIEQGRSKILTLIDQANISSDWATVENSFSIIETLTGITTVDEARIIKNQILSL